MVTTARIPTTTTFRVGGGGGGYRKRRQRKRPAFPRNRLFMEYPRNEETLKYLGRSWKTATPEQREMRRKHKFYGTGPYYPMEAAMSGQGGYWGDRIGGWLGLPSGMGSAVGDFIQQRVADPALKAIGLGPYEVNDIVNGGQGTGFNVPTFGPGVEGGITISHKEYLGEMYGPTNAAAFANRTFNINPGLEATFPWLSQVAANFDEYTLKQCIISFRSTVADFAAASGQVGQIIMATQYNVNAPSFTDKQAMMEYDASMSSKTSESMLHGIECDPVKLSGAPGKYIRTNALLQPQDLKDYDHAVTNVAVSNIPSTYQNQSLGELWITYTVELRKPRFYTARGAAISRDMFLATPIGGCSLNNPFASYLHGAANSIGATISTGVARKLAISLPPAYSGFLEIVFTIRSAGAGLTPVSDDVPMTLVGNVIPVNDMKRTSAPSVAVQATASGGALTVVMHLFVAMSTTGTVNSITADYTNAWLPTGQPPTDCTAELDIHEYNSYSFNNQTGKPAWTDISGNTVTVD